MARRPWQHAGLSRLVRSGAPIISLTPPAALLGPIFFHGNLFRDSAPGPRHRGEQRCSARRSSLLVVIVRNQRRNPQPIMPIALFSRGNDRGIGSSMAPAARQGNEAPTGAENHQAHAMFLQ